MGAGVLDDDYVDIEGMVDRRFEAIHRTRAAKQSTVYEDGGRKEDEYEYEYDGYEGGYEEEAAAAEEERMRLRRASRASEQAILRRSLRWMARNMQSRLTAPMSRRSQATCCRTTSWPRVIGAYERRRAGAMRWTDG